MSKQFHIKIEKVDDICIVAGNPDRIKPIADHLVDSTEVANHRGLIAYKGFTPNKRIPVTVLTTGMGCPSTAIVMEEIIRAGGKVIIRIGSTGATSSDPDIGVGSIFIPHAAVRDESTSRQYIPVEFPAAASPDIFSALMKSAEKMNIKAYAGIVWSTDIYYTEDRLPIFDFSKAGAVCIEMESSFIFTYGALKGIKTATILTADGNIVHGNSIYKGNVEKNLQKFNQSVNDSIDIVINAIEQFINI